MAVLQDVNINVYAQPSEKRVRTFLALSQNENGRRICFRILGAPLPSNCSATFSGTKPDGTVYTTTGTVTGNFVIVQEDMQMTAVPGVWDANLDVVNGTHNIVTAIIRVMVERGAVAPGSVPSNSQLDGYVAQCKSYAEQARTEAYGSPLTAATKSAMTDKTRVYVYTGSEANMTAGNWYYWNGSAWTSGGVYNAVAVQTDKTLTVQDKAADGKATGDALNALKEDLNAEANTSDTNAVMFGGELFTEQALTPISEWTQTGFKLSKDGYRVADEAYKLERYRVLEGRLIKVASPHRWQFQTSYTVPATGTQYKIGNTNGSQTVYTTVPETVTYVIVSTPIDETPNVCRLTSNIQTLSADAEAQKNKNDGMSDNINTLGESTYDVVSELTPPVNDMEGFRLDDDGYRVTDADYKIMRFRVFEGNLIKVCSDHKFQFQTSTTVPTSGTQYKVGRTMSDGTYYLTVPETVTYVVVSTPIESNAHVYRMTEKSAELGERLTSTESKIDGNQSRLAAIYNSYTSQVSDIPYIVTADIIRLGIDSSVPSFVSGSGYVICIPILPGTSIRVHKPQTPVCAICFTEDYPKAGTVITHHTSMGGVVNTDFVAVSETGDNYLAIYVGSTAVTAEDCSFAYSQTARGTVELLPQLDWRMLNLLKYRPVGKVSKAYIALSCDDGLEPLATYTLPRIQYWNNYYGTDIPLHMALFDNSPVFANAEYTALIKDMCDNHNCSIGIHGTQPYEYYSITNLYAYLKKQWDTIIEKTGVTPTSVIYPHSSYNDQIMVMTSGFCGICGASGSDASPYTYSDDHGLAFYVGEKSNCYEVYRLSIKDTRIGNANEAHRIIDYAIAHNLIICPYFHDIDFTNYSEETNNFNRAMLDAFIQYGMEQGVEFINFGDIPKML